ncbi:MAG: VCBS repeat-containing protein [Planctomycetota bacterium]
MKLLVTLALLSSATAAQNLFHAPQKLPFATRSIADVNGDGHMDALQSVFGGGLRAQLNDGNGVFVPATSVTQFGPGVPQLPAFETGDWNGDGHLDVAIAVLSGVGDPIGFGVRLALGDGAGNFGVPFHLTSPGFGGAALIAFADHDNDGRDGIAAVYYTSPTTSEIVWLSDVGAGLQVSSAVALPWTSTDVAAADLDGDGTDEVLVAETDTLHVFTFASGTPVLVDSISLAFPFSFNPTEVIAFDLESDGDLDAICIGQNLSPNETYIAVLVNDGLGNLTAQPAETFRDLVSLGTFDRVAGDWDGDGDVDLMGQEGALLTTYQVGWLENVGGGQFVRRQSLRVDLGGVPAGAADFDGDGNLDFLTNTVLVYGDGTFTSPLTTDLPPGASFDTVRDFDHDGDIDLVSWFGTAFDQLHVLVNDGTGQLSAGSGLLPPRVNSNLTFTQPATLADFDGDGLDEVVLAVKHVLPFPAQPLHLVSRRFVDDGSGTYVDAGSAAPVGVSLPVGQAPAVDLDGDGDVDILASGNVWLNNGAGFFLAATPIVAGDIRDVADVDGDGDLDLLTLRSFGTTKEVYLERHDGALGFTSEFVFGFTSTTIAEATLRFVNLDADGDLDVYATFTYWPGSNRVVSVRGAENVGGVFTPRGELASFSLTFNLLEAGAGDVDGDGRTDLVLLDGFATSSPFQLAHVLLQTSTPWVFAERVRYLTDATAFGDLESDGDLDLLGQALHRSRAFEGPGVGTIRQYGQGTAGTGGAIPVVGSTGPAREQEIVELRVRRGLGGSLAILARGLAEANVVNSPFVGLTTYVGSLLPLEAVVLDGPAGQAAAGDYTQTVPIGSGLAGQSFYVQAFVLDAGAASNLAASNGLEVTIGL